MGRQVRCSVCDTRFAPRFSYQRDRGRYFCSLACRTPELEASKPKTCSHCGNTFEVRFAYQVIAKRDDRRLVCSELCRAAALAEVQRATKRTRVLAVLNQKGGTGKTTTSVSVAAGLARRGRRVLLVDLDAQANSGISLGVRSDTTLYHVLAEDRPVREAIVAARRDLDLLASDQSLAVAELSLVESRDRAERLRRALRPVMGTYDDIILDCAPSLSILNQNALYAASEVLVPVSCDYLALVGVKQILRTLHHVENALLHPVLIAGVLPTFFDSRNRISRQVVEALNGHFGALVLPPVRVNARLKEAPSHKKTIFEYAPDSHGARDYTAVVDHLVGGRAPVEAPEVAEVASHG